MPATVLKEVWVLTKVELSWTSDWTVSCREVLPSVSHKTVPTNTRSQAALINQGRQNQTMPQGMEAMGRVLALISALMALLSPTLSQFLLVYFGFLTPFDSHPLASLFNKCSEKKTSSE